MQCCIVECLIVIIYFSWRGKIWSGAHKGGYAATEGSPWIDVFYINLFSKEPDPIPLTFYSNGFVLFEGPFRPYSTPSSIPFVRDLVDGYFPYELKEQYPNGGMCTIFCFVFHFLQCLLNYKIDLQRCMHSNSHFQPRIISVAEQVSKISVVLYRFFFWTIVDITSLGDTSIKNKSKEEFLKKLPASVIKNGRVLDIRQSIATSVFKVCFIWSRPCSTVAEWQSSKTYPWSSNRYDWCGQVSIPVVKILFLSLFSFLCNTDVISPCPQPINVEPKSAEQEIFSSVHKGRPTTPQAITTLKVKTHTIGTLIVKLRFDDTVATLRKYIDQYP